jgi:hypothetical protein
VWRWSALSTLADSTQPHLCGPECLFVTKCLCVAWQLLPAGEQGGVGELELLGSARHLD